MYKRQDWIVEKDIVSETNTRAQARKTLAIVKEVFAGMMFPYRIIHRKTTGKWLVVKTAKVVCSRRVEARQVAKNWRSTGLTTRIRQVVPNR